MKENTALITNEDMLLLLSCLGCSRSRIRRLLSAFPALVELTAYHPGESDSLCQMEKLPLRAQKLLHNPTVLTSAVQEERERLNDRGIRFLTPSAPDWPLRLNRMEDAPLWLFVKGTLPREDLAAVSVIGSRDASAYGLSMAGLIAESLVTCGVTVVSGMASGIDAAAQRAALRAGGNSLAILGSGINICYPKENFDLFDALIHTPGCGVISEFPLDSASAAWHFPDRNRLIAALGDCLALIEARSQRSGSMITVGQALEQGKEVFAVPGRITDPMSMGCNELIRTGATPLLSPDDILEYLSGIGVLRTACSPENTRRIPKLLLPENPSENQKRICACLSEEPCSLDEIVRKTGLRIGVAMEVLMELEDLGAVQHNGRNRYSSVYC